MNKRELINSLLEKDLNKYRFSVYATFTDDEIKYSYSLKGSDPQGSEMHVCNIGGISDAIYTFDLLDALLDAKLSEALEYKLSEF